MNSSSYPAEEDLKRIEQWPYGDLLGLMEFVKSLWWMPDWGWRQQEKYDPTDQPCTAFTISTGGWSGNESLIEAMRANHIFWSLCWVQSRRGGHFLFEVKELTAGAEKLEPIK